MGLRVGADHRRMTPAAPPLPDLSVDPYRPRGSERKGLTRSTPQASKSLMLRVATASPLELAMPAIWPSGTLIGRLIACRWIMISEMTLLSTTIIGRG